VVRPVAEDAVAFVEARQREVPMGRPHDILSGGFGYTRRLNEGHASHKHVELLTNHIVPHSTILTDAPAANKNIS
jgi:hypothetical protein